MLAEHPAIDHCRPELLAVALLDAKFDATIVEQKGVARANGFRQICVGGRYPAAPALRIADRNAKLIAHVQHQRRCVDQSADPDLRTAEVLKQGHGTINFLGHPPDAPNQLTVLLPRAVREIQPEDVDTRDQKVSNRRVVCRCGPKGCDDLRVSHGASLQYRVCR